MMWTLIEETLDNWIEDELYDRELRMLESRNWNDLDEILVLSKLHQDSRLRQNVHRFSRYLSAVAIQNNWQNTAWLVIRLNLLNIRATKAFNESSGELLENFWHLLILSRYTDFIVFDCDRGLFTIGNQIRTSFQIDVAPPALHAQLRMRFEGKKTQEKTSNGKFYSMTKYKLDQCERGRTYSSKFEGIGVDTLGQLFENSLGEPKKQVTSYDETRRTDAVFPILHQSSALGYFWQLVIEKYRTYNCVVDFKNYNRLVTKKEIVQMRDYLNQAVGAVGLIWTRGEVAPNALIERIDAFKSAGKLILIITDEDVLEMCQLRDVSKEPDAVLSALEFGFCTRFR